MTQVTIQENSDGDPYIQIPEQMLTSLKWKDGDDVEFIDNKDGTMSIRKTTTTRWAHVRDSMYELDEHGNECDKEYIYVTLPQFDKEASEDGDFPEEDFKVETLRLKMDPHDRTIYPCTAQATHQLQFKVVYCGQWAGNGNVFETPVVSSMSKEDLLRAADRAMAFTGNEHHCFLEGICYDQIDKAGVVHLRMLFGS